MPVKGSKKTDTVVTLRLRHDQIGRLLILREALEEQQGRKVTLGEILNHIIDGFLDSPE